MQQSQGAQQQVMQILQANGIDPSTLGQQEQVQEVPNMAQDQGGTAEQSEAMKLANDPRMQAFMPQLNARVEQYLNQLGFSYQNQEQGAQTQDQQTAMQPSQMVDNSVAQPGMQ